jgi:hypothetical protein
MTPVELRERIAIARRDAGNERVVGGMRIVHTSIQVRGGKSSAGAPAPVYSDGDVASRGISRTALSRPIARMSPRLNP